MRPIRYTRWSGGLYDINAQEPTTETWEQFTQRLSFHDRLKRKVEGRVFSPTILQAPTAPCIKHSRTDPHRCDACVAFLSCLVYDVDVGTSQDIEHCDGLLEDDGVARHWYSSYSFSEDKPSYRLILPISRDVNPAEWLALRGEVIKQYEIPCDPNKCKGLSHPFFEPSCPVNHIVPFAETCAGVEIDVDQMMPRVVGTRLTPQVLTGDWAPPPDPKGAVNISDKLVKLRNKLTGLERAKDPRKKQNAVYLRRCLEGVALAEHGHRNEAALVVSGILAYALPGTPLSVLKYIMRPSTEAMMREGSRITMETVERMLLTAMRNKAAADQQTQETLNRFERELGAYRASIKQQQAKGAA